MSLADDEFDDLFKTERFLCVALGTARARWVVINGCGSLGEQAMG